MSDLGHRTEKPVGHVVRGKVKVVVQDGKLEGFWKEVGRQWNRQAASKTPGCQDLLLTENEWVTLWRGLLATRCAYVDPEGEYPVYRALRPKRAEVPALMWECLYNYGLVSTEWGADYIVVGEADWPKPEEFSAVYAKWLSALSIYAAIMELSRSLPESEKAAPAFILSAVERGNGVVLQSLYPLKDVQPRDTLWAAIALSPVPEWGPPKTVYLEWDRELVVAEILRALREEG